MVSIPHFHFNIFYFQEILQVTKIETHVLEVKYVISILNIFGAEALSRTKWAGKAP